LKKTLKKFEKIAKSARTGGGQVGGKNITKKLFLRKIIFFSKNY